MMNIDTLSTLESFGIGMGFAFDSVRGEILISMPLAGKIYVYDSSTFERKRALSVELGVREIGLDPRRRILYIAGYVSGYLYCYDIEKQSMTGKVYVGSQIRHLSYCEDMDRILIASKAGFMEIDPVHLQSSFRATQRER